MLCDFESSDEEYEKLCKESKDRRVNDFVPSLDFESRALTKDEATFLLEEVKVPVNLDHLHEPVEKDEILLHSEASDS